MLIRVSCGVCLALVGGGDDGRAAKDCEGTRGLEREDWEATESRLAEGLARLMRCGLVVVPPWPLLVRLTTDSRRDEELYLLDRLERLEREERRRICSCSEIRDGPGTGGRGTAGGPVGGGLGDVLFGVGGRCVGGAGNDSRRTGTGGRFLGRAASMVA
jgi:hypothetical protein